MKDNRIHTPEGFRDIYGDELKLKNWIEDKLLTVMDLYHYEAIQTPTIEFFNVFSGEKGTAKSSEMYKLFDRENNTLVVRPDFTPSVSRAYTKYFTESEQHVRLCYKGQTFKNLLRLHGKLNEVTNIGAELIGDDESAADGEILSMVVESLLKLGLESFQISMGQVDYFRGIAEEFSLSKEEEQDICDAIANHNIFLVRELMEKTQISNEVVEIFAGTRSYTDTLDMLEQAKKAVNNDRSKNAIDRLLKVYQIISVYGYESYISVDLSMLSDYEYYTGIIFKGYTYGTGDAIVSGGRYNDLLAKYGVNRPSVGYAFTVDELMVALRHQNISTLEKNDSIMILYHKTRIEEAIGLARVIRAKEVSAMMTRKSSKCEIADYKSYAAECGINTIYYLDEASKEITEISVDNDEVKQVKVEINAGGAK